jgi:hypothetical protein
VPISDRDRVTAGFRDRPRIPKPDISPAALPIARIFKICRRDLNGVFFWTSLMALPPVLGGSAQVSARFDIRGIDRERQFK